MKIMCCDETNAAPSKNIEFFVYGGLVVDAAQIGPLSEDISHIRKVTNFGLDDSLKFRTSSRPANMDQADWTNAKAQTITACRDRGVTLIAYVIHHRIVRGATQEMTSWQLNTCSEEFNKRLIADDDHGMVIIDRIADHKEYKVLGRIFRTGGSTPWGKQREFNRIVSYSSTSDGASHLASAVDVVLGSFARCVNHIDDVTLRYRELFQSIEPLFTNAPAGSRTSNAWPGLILSPAVVKAPSYAKKYDELEKYLGRLSDPCK
jgi:hypothetical protein